MGADRDLGLPRPCRPRALNRRRTGRTSRPARRPGRGRRARRRLLGADGLDAHTAASLGALALHREDHAEAAAWLLTAWNREPPRRCTGSRVEIAVGTVDAFAALGLEDWGATVVEPALEESWNFELVHRLARHAMRNGELEEAEAILDARDSGIPSCGMSPAPGWEQSQDDRLALRTLRGDAVAVLWDWRCYVYAVVDAGLWQPYMTIRHERQQPWQGVARFVEALDEVASLEHFGAAIDADLAEEPDHDVLRVLRAALELREFDLDALIAYADELAAAPDADRVQIEAVWGLLAAVGPWRLRERLASVDASRPARSWLASLAGVGWSTGGAWHELERGSSATTARRSPRRRPPSRPCRPRSGRFGASSASSSLPPSARAPSWTSSTRAAAPALVAASRDALGSVLATRARRPWGGPIHRVGEPLALRDRTDPGAR